MRSAVLCVWDVICIGCKTEKAFLFWTLKAFALLGLPVSMDWAEYVEGGTWQQLSHADRQTMFRSYTAAVKSLLTVTTLLQQKLDCGCCAQCKWR